MWTGYDCWINFCHFFHIVNLVIFTLIIKTVGISCERNFSYSFVPILFKLCMCFPHGMRICMWIGHNCWINFCHFFGIVNLVIFHPEYIDSGCLL